MSKKKFNIKNLFNVESKEFASAAALTSNLAFILGLACDNKAGNIVAAVSALTLVGSLCRRLALHFREGEERALIEIEKGRAKQDRSQIITANDLWGNDESKDYDIWGDNKPKIY